MAVSMRGDKGAWRTHKQEPAAEGGGGHQGQCAAGGGFSAQGFRVSMVLATVHMAGGQHWNDLGSRRRLIATCVRWAVRFGTCSCKEGYAAGRIGRFQSVLQYVYLRRQ